jgi:hypothetical protein
VTDGQRDGSAGREALELVVGGRKLRFPAIWLRDNCPCAACVDPGSGQKFNDITDLPNGLVVAAAQDTGESVMVTYAPGQHQSVFSRRWLAEHALDGYGDGGGRTEDDKDLWVPADLEEPRVSWPRYLAEPAERARALDAVLRLGFVLLHDVPAESGMVLEVAASFGFVRETNYGRLFDVRVEPAPGPPLSFAPGTQDRLRCSRKGQYRSDMSIKRQSYGPASRSLSLARAAGSAGCGSTTGRRGRCGCRMRTSPGSTRPTGGGPSCSRSRSGS